MRARNFLTGQFYRVEPKGNLDDDSLLMLLHDLKRTAIELECLEKVSRQLKEISPVLSSNIYGVENCLREDSYTLTKMLRYLRDNNVTMFDVQNFLISHF